LPIEALAEIAGGDKDLQTWWQAYLDYSPNDLPPQRNRIHVTAPLQLRLLAKYDLLAVEPGKSVVIVDWKTNRKRTPASRLRERVQTRLYPFLMVLAARNSITVRSGNQIRLK
jgi:ATP-dependent exoDNAse (exonuclease V) beta subunit